MADMESLASMNLSWLYILAIYAIAIWVARRSGVDLPWRVAAFFYGVVLMFFWSVLTGDFVNVPVDCLKGLPPWTYLRREWYVINGEANDLPLQLVPWAHQVRESWKALHVPLWNALSGGGYPLMANGQSSALSLVRVLALPLPLGQALSAEAAMKILIAMTFTWLYCRGRRYSEMASTIAAVAFGLSGFLICWLHFAHATVACFAPAVLYCIDRLAERRTFGRFVFAAAIGTLILFGGHPETAAHLFVFAAAYVAWMMFIERPRDLSRKKFIGSLAGAVGVATLLAMPYLATLFEALPHSMRILELTQKPPSGIVGGGDWVSAILLLQPHIFGQVPLEKPWHSAGIELASGYASVLGFAACLALLVNAILTRTWRAREMFFVVATVFVAGAILNWPVFRHLLHFVLPLAANGRVRLLLTLLLSIQIAAAIDLVRRLPMLIGIFVVSATLFALLHVIPFPAQFWRDTAVLAMLPSLAVLAIATFAWKRESLLMLTLVAVVAELSFVGRDRNPAITDELLYPRTPLIHALDKLRAAQPPNNPFRIAGTGAVLYPNTQAMFGYDDIRLHDPMANRHYAEFLALTGGLEITGRYHPWWEPSFDPTVLDFLNVRYVVAYRDAKMINPEHLRLVHEGLDGRIFENQSVLPRFFPVRNIILDFDKSRFAKRLQTHGDWSSTALLDRLTMESGQQERDFFQPRPEDAPRATARIVAADPTDYRLRIRAPRWSLIASSVPWWPGWKVERNGRRVDPIRVNGAFLGFAVPPGHSEVRVHYAPWTFRYGLLISLVTIAGLIVVRISSLTRARREPRTKPITPETGPGRK